jgi:DNA-binding beta-propeller fold protein YncE
MTPRFAVKIVLIALAAAALGLAPVQAAPPSKTVSEVTVVPFKTVSEVTVTPLRCPYAAGPVTLEVPGHPFMAQASDDGCWLFVAMGAPEHSRPGDGGVAVLHNEGGGYRLARVQPVKAYPGGLSLSHDGKTLAVATYSGVMLLDVARLETGDGDARIAALPMGAGAVFVAISRDDRLLFVSEDTQPRLAVFDFVKAREATTRDLADKATIGAIQVGLQPVGLTFSADGRRLYVTSESVNPTVYPPSCPPEVSGIGEGRVGARPEGILSVIDVAAAGRNPSDALLAMRRAGCAPVRVALSPDGAIVWVTARGEERLEGFAAGALKGVSAARPEIIARVGPSPIGIAVRPDGTQVWVAASNRYAGRRAPGLLTAVSPTGQVLRTVATGAFPRDLSFLPDGKTLVVAQYESQAVQFVPTDAP